MPSPSGFREAESEWGHIAACNAAHMRCITSGSNPDTPTINPATAFAVAGFILFKQSPDVNKLYWRWQYGL